MTVTDQKNHETIMIPAIKVKEDELYSGQNFGEN